MKLLDTITLNGSTVKKPANYFESIGAYNYDMLFIVGTAYMSETMPYIYTGIVPTEKMVVGNNTRIIIYFCDKNFQLLDGKWQFSMLVSSEPKDTFEIYGVVM